MDGEIERLALGREFVPPLEFVFVDRRVGGEDVQMRLKREENGVVGVPIDLSDRFGDLSFASPVVIIYHYLAASVLFGAKAVIEFGNAFGQIKEPADLIKQPYKFLTVEIVKICHRIYHSRKQYIVCLFSLAVHI